MVKCVEATELQKSYYMLLPKHLYRENPYNPRCGDFVNHIKRTSFLPFPLVDNITSNLTSQEVATLRSVEDYLWQQMVVKRNRKMTQRINTLLRSQRNHTFFLGLGAGWSFFSHFFKLKCNK